MFRSGGIRVGTVKSVIQDIQCMEKEIKNLEGEIPSREVSPHANRLVLDRIQDLKNGIADLENATVWKACMTTIRVLDKGGEVL